MIAGPATRFSAEVADAGRGLLRLLRLDPTWARAFDLSVGGFLRSFLAPLMALPLTLLTTEAVNRGYRAGGQPHDGESLIAAAVVQLIDMAGYPLILALLARPTGIAGGYAAFVTVTNWASLFLTALVALAALPVLWIGSAGLAPFGLAAWIGLCASLVVLWRAGRETLGGGIGPTLMAVVLAVGVDAVAGRIVHVLAI